jgi:hypothetical protein
MFALPRSSIRTLCRHWVNRLAHYRHHRNDEHREALIVEALRFAGLTLENELIRSPYWSDAPLARRVALLLYLVDRGAVERVVRPDRVVFEATDDAETWVSSQPSLAPYLPPTLELIAALRAVKAHRPARG